MRNIKKQLSELTLKPSKKKGQNFLIDDSVLERIVGFGSLQIGTQKIIEIGPGLGALTNLLVPFGDVTVIEIEEKFCSLLKEQYPSLNIIQQDIREVLFSDLGTNLLVFGNLPYSFSTEIIFHLIDQRAYIERAIIMLQKEFADRLGALPGGKSYGVLSIMVQQFAEIKEGFIVPGNAFHPPTRVDSKVIEVTFFKEPRFPVLSYDIFRRVVKAAFSQRRKKIINSISASNFFPSIDLKSIFNELGLDTGRRAETFRIEEFGKLSDSIFLALPKKASLE